MSMMMPIEEFKQAFNSFKHNKRSCKVKKTFSEVEMCDILKKSNLFPGYTLHEEVGMDVNGNSCDMVYHRDDDMSVIMHGDDPRELWMFVKKGDENYSATYYAKSGRISLGMVPLEFTAGYMELVKEYFLPFVEEHKEAK